MGHRDRQLRIRQLQEPESVVLGDGVRGLHRVANLSYLIVLVTLFDPGTL